MTIQYNSCHETGMSGISVFRLRTSVMFVLGYWVTGKKVDNN